MPSIRKIATFIEDGLTEAGIPVDPLYRKVAVAAVIENPYAGRFSEDLGEIIDFSVGLGDLLANRLVEAMGEQVNGYGKASIVGMKGEVEHGHAFLTTPMANRFREAVGGGRAWISSTGKRGALGTIIDVPLAHKDALKVRSFYDTMTVSVPDAPEPDEVVVIIAGVNRGRPNFRLGGLLLEDMIGEDGLH
ncbi:MAG: amino acid synthesis family protein [Gammaproteobacteria bacterium]|nr:amino acid synthesis family protein [Gammaproteobacteria bacterium]